MNEILKVKRIVADHGEIREEGFSENLKVHTWKSAND